MLLMVGLVLAPMAQADALVPPSPPQDVTVSYVPEGVQVSWDPPAFTGGSSQITYRVYKDSALVADNLAVTNYLDDSIGMSAASASYVVTAVNEAGESVQSGGPCLAIEPPGIDPANCVGLAIALVFWIIEQATALP